MVAASLAPARRAAWDVLAAWLVAGPERGRLGSAGRPFPPADLAPRDRALARQLAEGAVRRWRSLETILTRLAGGRVPRPAGVRAALLLGAYQLVFERQLPARSVVHDAVTLARRAAGDGGAKFANALLRRIAARPELDAWLPPPPPESRDAAAIGTYFSCPDALVERWLAEHGAATTRELLAGCNADPVLALRVNRTRIDRETVAERLLSEGVRTRAGLHPLTLIVDKGASAAALDTTAFARGLFAVQDTSQTEIIDTLDLAPGQRVLDSCAAPGGKATAIAEAMNDRGIVLAYDADPERLARLPRELQRLGLRSVRVLTSPEALDAELSEGSVDRVLVDAPCSNTGVLGRRVEARWRFDPAQLRSLAAQQERIVQEAAAVLAPGGRLVYATCSIEPEENEGVAARVAGSSLRMISTERVLPEAGLRDGCGVSVFDKAEP